MLCTIFTVGLTSCGGDDDNDTYIPEGSQGGDDDKDEDGKNDGDKDNDDKDDGDKFIPEKTVHLDMAGTLPDKITESEMYTTKSLKISGVLNGTDILFIRKMLGVDQHSNPTGGILEELDISDAKIVPGGDEYYKNYKTSYDAIGSYMFHQIKNLKMIKLPSTIKGIRPYAFEGCTGLTSIILPKGLERIGPEGEACIGYRAFGGCTGLTSVTLPEGLEYVGGFEGCTGLTSVTLPESLGSIGYAAFSGTRLTSVTLPESLKIIEYAAFYGVGLTSVTLPESLKKIGKKAFCDCTELTSVTLPEELENISIDVGVFYRCNNLKSVYIKAKKAPHISIPYLFYFTNDNIPKLYVPRGSLNDYKNSNWHIYFKEIYEYDF